MPINIETALEELQDAKLTIEDTKKEIEELIQKNTVIETVLNISKSLEERVKIAKSRQSKRTIKEFIQDNQEKFAPEYSEYFNNLKKSLLERKKSTILQILEQKIETATSANFLHSTILHAKQQVLELLEAEEDKPEDRQSPKDLSLLLIKEQTANIMKKIARSYPPSFNRDIQSKFNALFNFTKDQKNYETLTRIFTHKALLKNLADECQAYVIQKIEDQKEITNEERDITMALLEKKLILSLTDPHNINELEDLLRSADFGFCIFNSQKTKRNLTYHPVNLLKTYYHNINKEIKQTFPSLKSIYKILEAIFLYPIAIPLRGSLAIKQAKKLEKIKARTRELIKIFRNLYIQNIALDTETLTKDNFLELFTKHTTVYLLTCCRKYGFPLPETISSDNEIIDHKKPNICIDGLGGADSLTKAREIDRQGKANVVLTCELDMDEISDLDTKPKVLQGAVYKNGKIYSTTFRDPLDIHYIFPNHHNKLLLKHIETHKIPTGDIPFLKHYTGNKEFSNKILSDNNIKTPPSICWKSEYRQDEYPRLLKIEKKWDIKYQKSKTQEEIETDLKKFIQEHNAEHIVIKPTIGECGNDIIFFSSDDIENAAKYIIELSEKDLNVIVEKRITSVPLFIDGKKKDWNIRAFASYPAKFSGMVVRVDDDKNKPVNISITAQSANFHKTAKQLNLTQKQTETLYKDIEKIAIDSYNAIVNATIKNEGLSPNEKQDWMGIDIIIHQEGDKLIPYVIEINNQSSGGMYGAEKTAPPEEDYRICYDVAAIAAEKAEEYFTLD